MAALASSIMHVGDMTCSSSSQRSSCNLLTIARDKACG
jgi:hypothetical protein